MRVWYFFISLGLFAISAISFFVSFATWESTRRVPEIPSRPLRIAVSAGAGVALLGLSLFLLTL